ncbi:type I 3-dehydroquinate dehydratase [Bacillus sp. DTU_2020_1000418_1_SI_GHA_SEK_038]|uniref:type I 3-dehydroquinate dehydratase n=1 Tax=Bacillus sp. DTU_2020_1000418_1_SI_GHA_SEK_038 TaxID=3077585 RepID=UPI0028E5B4D1|nr:type I 3-dehydroquinate dehydratase [Bacillus sp. DTU_2020_1000418_1_SI_GHA_SEK_038]WNS77634.1 type I 3-dehydroquinate dehydratase [Bacillus sp. DTU_2020_1000418_1_SI_GHA_SEK_038]
MVKVLLNNKGLAVKNIVIGDGRPKICVPIIGETISQIKEEAEFLKTIHADLVEWRADFFENVEDINQVKLALEVIHGELASIPIIFTFRSAKEGGEKDISLDYYTELNKAVIKTGLVDIIDVELFSDEDLVKEVVHTAHTNHVFVIISNHDFEKTPPKDEIIKRLRKAQELGGDLPKIAVMPTTAADVLTLLEATLTMNEHYADRPIITMSMADKGIISRLSGGIFGSSITFGSAKKASAPGQIAAAELRGILNLLYWNK